MINLDASAGSFRCNLFILPCTSSSMANWSTPWYGVQYATPCNTGKIESVSYQVFDAMRCITLKYITNAQVSNHSCSQCRLFNSQKLQIHLTSTVNLL